MDLQPYIPIPVSNESVGRNCVLTAINYVTSRSGGSLSETDLFILSNGFIIKYYYDLRSIGKLNADIFLDLEKETSIRFDFRRRDYEGITVEDMAHALEEGNLVLLLVDTERLRYSRIYSGNENRQHAIILNGLSPDKKHAHIVDPLLLDYSGNASVYAGVVPMEEAMDAAYACAWLEPGKIKEIPKTKIWEAAYKGFDRFLKGSEEKEYAQGLAAIKNFLDDFHKLNLLDDNMLAVVCRDINYSIKIRSINLINKFMIDFINENDAGWGQKSAVLTDNIQEHIFDWEKVGLSVLRAGISKRRSAFSHIREKTNTLFKSQLNVYNEFSKYLGGIGRLRQEIKNQKKEEERRKEEKKRNERKCAIY
ncbi:MAG: BtrH N-terminal domain-containing protein [Acetivibrionales bacterium]